ncbi:CsbD family protein [Sphingomonas sp.]|uniref:CsbD family protein n=1 Tax=Sphingomonas sp. TaxID=28214 RepID=UPI002EDBB4A7
MNKDEFQGGARYLGGKVEKAVGDVADSREWKVDGVVDQVAGGAQHLYGRAKSIIGDVIDSAPALADTAREQLEIAGARIADRAQTGGKAAARTVQDRRVLWVTAAAMLGYGIAWLVHARRD